MKHKISNLDSLLTIYEFFAELTKDALGVRLKNKRLPMDALA